EGRGVVIGELPAGVEECEPLRSRGTVLLACVGDDRAMVLDTSPSLHVERTFDGLGDLDRFVGDDDAGLGFVGPCDGGAPKAGAPDVVTTASTANTSNQRSEVFCVRAGPGHWVEHRLDPQDARDVTAWVPRPDGGA